MSVGARMPPAPPDAPLRSPYGLTPRGSLTAPPRAPSGRAGAAGSEVSRRDLLGGAVLELLGHHLLALAVLLLEVLQPFDVVGLHAAVVLVPAVEGVLETWRVLAAS